jgi:hypothetical protein
VSGTRQLNQRRVGSGENYSPPTQRMQTRIRRGEGGAEKGNKLTQKRCSLDTVDMTYRIMHARSSIATTPNSLHHGQSGAMDNKPLQKWDAEKMNSSAGAHDTTKTLTLPAGPTRTEAPLAEKQPLNDQST